MMFKHNYKFHSPNNNSLSTSRKYDYPSISCIQIYNLSKCCYHLGTSRQSMHQSTLFLLHRLLEQVHSCTRRNAWSYHRFNIRLSMADKRGMLKWWSCQEKCLVNIDSHIKTWCCRKRSLSTSQDRKVYRCFHRCIGCNRRGNSDKKDPKG